jgi:hypothetical protein
MRANTGLTQFIFTIYCENLCNLVVSYTNSMYLYRVKSI